MSCLIFYDNWKYINWSKDNCATFCEQDYLVLSSSSPLINFILTFSSANEIFGDTLSVAIERPWWPWHLEAHLVFPELETSFTDHRQWWWQITLLHIFIFPIFSNTSLDTIHIVCCDKQHSRGTKVDHCKACTVLPDTRFWNQTWVEHSVYESSKAEYV